MNSKDEFWYGMDLQDIESAGAFVEKKIWDEFIVRKPDGVQITPRDYTK